MGCQLLLDVLSCVDQMTLPVSVICPIADGESQGTGGGTPRASATHTQVSETPESWEMGFLLPEKSKEPHGEDAALPTWESLERTVHTYSHVIGSKC